MTQRCALCAHWRRDTFTCATHTQATKPLPMYGWHGEHCPHFKPQ